MKPLSFEEANQFENKVVMMWSFQEIIFTTEHL